MEIEFKTTSRKIFITVIGGSECSPQIALMAEEVGREIARHGAILVCGGLGGVMEAACKGACAEGGLTVGVLPGESRRTANPYVQIPIVTGIGYARNVAVVKSGQVVIAIDGSYGTLSEIGHALQSGIPVIGLNTWSLQSDGKEDRSIIRAENPKDAVKKALEVLNSQYPE
ncbi:MAG: TIGR00725 family protein [Chloroflexi bacterium RBG_16_50_9]|nr:MAG: TIGR00725 family protein [Chloroflexi bacterium RBG_16_50_9]